MDGQDWLATTWAGDPDVHPDSIADLDSLFSGNAFRTIEDAAPRRARIASLVAASLASVVSASRRGATDASFLPQEADAADLVALILGPDQQAATAFVADLRTRGVPAQTLFGDLLEPAARLMGEMWERDEIDFIDVALGVARLQALLAMFNGTHKLAGLDARRSVLMLTLPDEQHSFGVAMVEQCLEAGGWQVRSEREISPGPLARLVQEQWFAVVGIAVSGSRNLPRVASAIESIRKRSTNRSVGVIVGGPIFRDSPDLAAELGADGAALTGPLAVILAQKLLDDALAPATEQDGPGLACRQARSIRSRA